MCWPALRTTLSTASLLLWSVSPPVPAKTSTEPGIRSLHPKSVNATSGKCGTGLTTLSGCDILRAGPFCGQPPMNRIRGFVTVICALISIPTCDGVRACRACIDSLFTGFNYVGDYPAGTNALQIKPKQVQPFPGDFEPGKIYIFQPTERVETERIAINIFPSRLRKCSATILYAPHNPGDFAAASLGGPFWGIRFRLGSCIGHLTNRYDPVLAGARIGWPSGSRDDYILQLESSK